MQKVWVGVEMSTRWTDPPMILMGLAVSLIVAICAELYFLWWWFPVGMGFPVVVLCFAWWFFSSNEPATTDSFLNFTDSSFAAKWKNKRIPISTLVEGYLDGSVDFVNDDVIGVLRNRDKFVSYNLTFSMLKFLLQQFIPIVGISSSYYDKATCKREIADHYDRHSDFFESFLGPSMVYTSAIWKDPSSETLEDAQKRKMDTICKKIHMKPGMTMLDIGCGWGTLARHGEKYFGATATGVTLSGEGARYARGRNDKESTKAEILEMDYRDIPRSKVVDCITCIEMAEHVGISNFQPFLAQVKSHLKDDGMFMMQVAGLRQGSNWEDVAWGLFMSRYIFPGADASTPLNWYIRQLELAGFEVRSVETIGRHYSHTLHAWYKYFMKNNGNLDKKQYPERLIRLWKFFLAWSTIASGQGSATCYQIACHKNTYEFDRDQFLYKKEQQ